MSWIGEEASGVRQHSDKAGKQADIRERGQLRGHSRFVIIEPPGAAVLQLAYRRGILETSDNTVDHGVVRRIEAVDNRLGQTVPALQGI